MYHKSEITQQIKIRHRQEALSKHLKPRVVVPRRLVRSRCFRPYEVGNKSDKRNFFQLLVIENIRKCIINTLLKFFQSYI